MVYFRSNHKYKISSMFSITCLLMIQNKKPITYFIYRIHLFITMVAIMFLCYCLYTSSYNLSLLTPNIEFVAHL